MFISSVSLSLSFTLLIYFMCAYACVWVPTAIDQGWKSREQLARVSSLLQCGFWESDSGHEAWHHSSAQPSCQLKVLQQSLETESHSTSKVLVSD